MIQIKDRFTKKIIHEGYFATFKDCVEDAVQKGINLAWTNLAGANLAGTNLTGTNLYRANLKNANLENANLAFANLKNANLENANLISTNLYRANLENTYLAYANLSGANLKNANLACADLEGANLAYANLANADLENANLTNAKMPDKPVILPSVGEAIIGFKKLANNIVIKVEIPADADRVTTWKSRKCRASALRVIEVMQNPDNISTDCMPGWYDQSFVYSLAKPETSGEAGDKLGELHHPDQFDSDGRLDCRPGLHFFMTLEEAVEWGR
jgi:hypothetical protein